jgi:hypothetical protein
MSFMYFYLGLLLGASVGLLFHELIKRHSSVGTVHVKRFEKDDVTEMYLELDDEVDMVFHGKDHAYFKISRD